MVAMRVRSQESETVKPAQSSPRKSKLATAIESTSYVEVVTANGEVIKVPVENKPVISAEVVSMQEARENVSSVQPSVSGQDLEDDSIAYEAWLEAFSLVQYDNSSIPVSSVRKGNIKKKDGSIKQQDINKIMCCWLVDGDKWGGGDKRTDSDFPTRAKYLKRNGLSNFHRRRLRLAVDNGPIYKGPHWDSSLSNQKPIVGFESWVRPPTFDQLLAEHWANLARYSDYDYEEVFIHPRKKIEGKRYEDWPLAGDVSVMNWKVRDASCWGPPPGESTAQGVDKLYTPTIISTLKIDQEIEQQQVFEVVAKEELDLSLYGTKVEEYKRDLVLDESLSLIRIGKRLKNQDSKLLHSKIKSRSNNIEHDKHRYNKWLLERMVHNSRKIVHHKVDKTMKLLFGTLQPQRLTQQLKKFNIVEKVHYKHGKYTHYEPVARISGASSFAGGPVIHNFPAPTEKLSDEARYGLWLYAADKTEPSPYTSDETSESLIRIRCSINVWRYLFYCGRIPKNVFESITPEMCLLPAPKEEDRVTFSEEVLLNEVKKRNKARLERDFEFLDLSTKKEPAVGDLNLFVGPPKEETFGEFAKALEQKLVIAQPSNVNDYLRDPAFDRKVLGQMRGVDAFTAKVAKDIVFAGRAHKLDESKGIIIPTDFKADEKKSEEISPRDFIEMRSSGGKEFGRKRGRLLEKVSDFLFK